MSSMGPFTHLTSITPSTTRALRSCALGNGAFGLQELFRHGPLGAWTQIDGTEVLPWLLVPRIAVNGIEIEIESSRSEHAAALAPTATVLFIDINHALTS